MSVVDILLKMDEKDFKMPRKEVEILRLSKLSGKKVEFELQGISQAKMDEINDMVMTINTKTRDFKINVPELKLAVICEGVVTPNLREKGLLEHFKAATPYDLVKQLLTPGERDTVYEEIQKLSGYGEDSVADVKKP